MEDAVVQKREPLLLQVAALNVHCVGETLEDAPGPERVDDVSHGARGWVLVGRDAFVVAPQVLDPKVRVVGEHSGVNAQPELERRRSVDELVHAADSKAAGHADRNRDADWPWAWLSSATVYTSYT